MYSLPAFIILVAVSAPTMHGIPSSRLTIAAWAVTPPLSVTIALASFIYGTKSGFVIVVTSMSPFLTDFAASSGVKTILATPNPISLLPAAMPFTTTFISESLFGTATSSSSFSFVLQTVSGLDCTMKTFFGNAKSLSIAHSISWGLP